MSSIKDNWFWLVLVAIVVFYIAFWTGMFYYKHSFCPARIEIAEEQGKFEARKEMYQHSRLKERLP